MFVETKREGEAPIKPDFLQLGTLIAWLEQQPAKKTYEYGCNGHCLLAQYFTFCGFKDVSVGPDFFRHGPEVVRPKNMFSQAFADIAVNEPFTFGAALKRARAEAE
jgi:hypothetical protein